MRGMETPPTVVLGKLCVMHAPRGGAKRPAMSVRPVRVLSSQLIRLTMINNDKPMRRFFTGYYIMPSHAVNA